MGKYNATESQALSYNDNEYDGLYEGKLPARGFPAERKTEEGRIVFHSGFTCPEESGYGEAGDILSESGTPGYGCKYVAVRNRNHAKRRAVFKRYGGEEYTQGCDRGRNGKRVSGYGNLRFEKRQRHLSERRLTGQ